MDEIAVSPDHPALAGHFPDRPVVPGALLLAEAIAHVEREAGSRVARVVRAKFAAVLEPGMRARVAVERDAAGAYRVSCRADGRAFLDAVVEVEAEA